MLSQLVYVSNRKASCTIKEIEHILNSCKKNNASRNITGVLLYSQTQFIQYLEGEAKEILGLYEKIKEDPRHEKTVMVSFGPIHTRLFPSWQMATRQIDQANIYFRTDISHQDKEVFKQLLEGNSSNDSKVQGLLKKFFS
jgi:hypothetical protein